MRDGRIFPSHGNKILKRRQASLAGRNVQKSPLSDPPNPGAPFHRQGRRLFGARGAYSYVREDDKGPRTPLADFFNAPVTIYGITVMFT